MCAKSNDKLIIPNKIKVGFQNREDTYTKQLAYVVYYDDKGVLRKEKSWESWRDKKIEAVEYSNEPMEGFVLNKGVGGARQSYGWNARNEYIRVYDPRGFEFEISVANLLFILKECVCNKGKGLEGKFVYAWSGTELVLLPTASDEYNNSKDFTSLQSCSVAVKDLVPGYSYKTKQQEIWMYVGKLPSCFKDSGYGRNKSKANSNHVFWNGNNFLFLKDLKQLATIHNNFVVDDFAFVLDKYNKSKYGSKPVRLFLKEKNYEFGSSHPNFNDYYYNQLAYFGVDNKDGSFLLCNSVYDRKYDHINRKYIYEELPTYTNVYCKVGIENNKIVRTNLQIRSFRNIKDAEAAIQNINHTYFSPLGQKQANLNRISKDYIVPTNCDLCVELESGSVFVVGTSDLEEFVSSEEGK